jgi:membrane protein
VVAEQPRRTLLTRVRDRLARAQDRSPLADRVVRTVDRYLDAQGSLLAAGLTYYGLLAIFPLVAVALGVGSVLSKVVPRIGTELTQHIQEVLPTVDVGTVQAASIAVGLVGLAVMLYAGVRWVGALRRSLSLLWGREPRSVPFLRGLVRDIATLALLGLAVLASAALTVLTQLATTVLQDHLADEAYATTVRVVSLAAALLTNFAIGWVLFRALPDSGLRGRELLAAAVLVGLGLEVLKQAAALVIRPASHNLVYGTFAATVGALIWISYVCRWILLVAAWSAVRLEAGGPAPGLPRPGASPGPRADLPAAEGSGQEEQPGPDGDAQPRLRRQA